LAADSAEAGFGGTVGAEYVDIVNYTDLS